MSTRKRQARLETEAIVIGYAMSRLDRFYLTSRGYSGWEQAYSDAANVLTKPPSTFKNLRDEFDPIHANPRQGWHNREMRASRQRVLDELSDVSDDALMELVDRILKCDEDAIVTAINSLTARNHVAYNVAQRLLTGRLAEEFFLVNSMSLINVSNDHLIDLRQAGCGYDFGVQHRLEWAIEVKGLSDTKGNVQFTDREWSEAKLRRENYWIIIVANLPTRPIPKVIRDPYKLLQVRSRYRHTFVVEWHSFVSVDTI